MYFSLILFSEVFYLREHFMFSHEHLLLFLFYIESSTLFDGIKNSTIGIRFL